MSPFDFFIKLSEQVKFGEKDFLIADDGSLSVTAVGTKNAEQKKRDSLVLNLALTILYNKPIPANQIDEAYLANKLIQNLQGKLKEKEVKPIIRKLQMAIEIEFSGTKLKRVQSQALTTDFRNRLEPRPIHKKYPLERQKSWSSSSSGGAQQDDVTSSSSAPNFKSIHFDYHLELEEIYPPQDKVKDIPRIRSNSKKLKNIVKKIEQYSHLGPNAFEGRVTAPMLESLNQQNMPKQIGMDIYRYLFRDGILFSTSEESELKAQILKGKTKDDLIAERLIFLIQMMATLFPSQQSKAIQAFSKVKFSIQDDPVEFQQQIQDLAEKTKKFPLLFRLFQSLAQDHPNRLASFIMNAGMMLTIDLERLPISICLHHEKKEQKIYLIYKTYFKERDITKRSIVGDPISIFISSKIFFSLDLKAFEKGWVYVRHSLDIGLPEKPNKKWEENAKVLFYTFTALNLEPSYSLSPAIVPEQLSRL